MNREQGLETYVEESNIVHGVFKLICKLLFPARNVELPQVQSDEIGPGYFVVLMEIS